ncbi:NACHT domain-containing protein [Streptomyces mirabilis]|uniref:NACHT domain-containing protein n=1 Tax=Streptomyces mirabilis TaxID=68239 RepID=UPI003647CB9E
MRKALKAKRDTFSVEALQRIPDLTPAARDKIVQFIESGDFEQLTLQLSIALSAGRKKDLAKLRQSLAESMRLYRTVPDSNLESVSSALFDDLQQSITANLGKLGAEKRFSLASAKFASTQAAAGARNCEILKRLNDLHSYDEFHRALSRQVSLVESKVRPPQIDTGSRITIDRIYVQSDLIENDGESDRSGDFSLLPKDIFDIYPRVVILGDPGGGKSTLATKLCVDLARGRNRGSAAKVPFKIVMRDYANYFQRSKVSIIEYIEKVCSAKYSTPAPEGCVDYLLLNSRAAVIFDGLDELTNTALRQDMVSAVEAFTLAYPGTPVMVTSRKVGYDLSPLDGEMFESVTLGRFSYEQRKKYVKNWFGVMRTGSQAEKVRLANEFLRELSHADDLSSNPLMLGLMCALYRGVGYIPRNRPELYRRCSEFLFERWDASRDIAVEKPFERGIQYGMFALALNLMKSADAASGLTEKQLVQFTTGHLHGRYYEDFDSAQDAARQFVQYCRGRAWVLTDVGTDEAGNDLYAFTHRTFLEYFAARQLVRECSDIESLIDVLYPKLRVQEWDVVAQLTIQTLDERFLDGSNETMLALIERAKREEGEIPRLAISSFCARSVEFMDLRPGVLRGIVDFFVDCLGANNSDGHDNPPLRSSVGGLLSCPMELRPVLADQIRVSVASAKSKSDALAFAISLGGGYMENDFWTREDEKNVDAFLPELKELCASEPWFAARLYKLRKVSLEQVITWHGLRSIFSERGLKAPYPRGDNIFTHVVYFDDYVERIGEAADVDLEQYWGREAEELANILMAAPRPWVSRLDSHAWVHDYEDPLPANANALFLRIINLALAGESIVGRIVNQRQRFHVGSRGAIYGEVLRARSGRVGTAQLRASLSMLTAPQVDFITRWAGGESDIFEHGF